MDPWAVASTATATLSLGLSLVLLTRRGRDNGVCVFPTHGTVLLRRRGRQTVFQCDLRGLTEGRHGFHVHAPGDTRGGCASTCAHYNPTGSAHGGPTGRVRHRGDLGNLRVAADGTCRDEIVADVRLDELFGRALLIHEGEDDLGKGGDAESARTGNAGARLSCAVIGRL